MGKKKKPGVSDPTHDYNYKHLHEMDVIKKEDVNVDIINGKHYLLPLYSHGFCLKP